MDEYIFGANILENLTTGMYKDSKVIFREYIQNACDQIDKAVELGILTSTDEGRIEIWLDEERRTISIEDNATGIPQADFRKTLADIADSSKKIGEDKGFRGIGRLCGLAYCRELIFTSKAKGENVISVMRCDAKKMRELLNRNINGEKFTASGVLNQIYKFEDIPDNTVTDEHWFRVELIGVNEENTELLNFDEVKNYLSFVAPVRYKNTFIYQSEIYAHAKEIGYKIDEYNISLNGEDDISKKYSSKFRTSKGEDDISGVEFKDFYDDNGNLIMWLWFGISQFKGIIEKGCEMRGIRLRKENIQIGSEDALQKLFKEDRGQHYFIGELFAVSKDLIPNSQRDYFNENTMRVKFEDEIRRYFKDVLQKVYYNASSLNSSFKKIEDFQKKTLEHQKKINNGDYIDSEDIAKAESTLKEAESKAIEARKKIDKLKQTTGNTETDSVLQKVANGIAKEHSDRKKSEVSATNSVEIRENVPAPSSKKTAHRVDKLSKLNKKERKLVSRIWGIIKDNTDDKTAEIIINKIEEEYK
ncbi:MAG: ATP-binding protein [Ruminococcus sp.]|nr:ATP-binding protein [Ruminococcus sp.]